MEKKMEKIAQQLFEIAKVLDDLVEAVKDLRPRQPNISNTLLADRIEIRKRWPGLKASISTNEVFDRHCHILDGEPSFKNIADWFAEHFEKERLYPLALINVYVACDARFLEAMLFFGDIGCIINLEKKSHFYLYEKGKPAPEATWIPK